MCSDIEILQRFFSLENERNWRDYEAYLSEDIEWILNENESKWSYMGKRVTWREYDTRIVIQMSSSQ